MKPIALNTGYLTSDRSAAGDECYTPYYAVEPLLEFVPKDKIIWCPFDEDWSAFYQTFKEHGYKVVRSSLVDGQDFFTHEPQEHWDMLVSNPPFSRKDDVLERAYALKKPFALLLPANSIQGKKRFKIFKNRDCISNRVNGNNLHKKEEGVKRHEHRARKRVGRSTG